jgi:thiol-disulfide isomerase/thioredoxin
MTRKAQQDNEGRVITIGWQPVALVLLLVLVVGAGFVFGNLLGGGSDTQTAAQLGGAGGAPVANSAGQGGAGNQTALAAPDADGLVVSVPDASDMVIEFPAQAIGSGQDLEISAQSDLSGRFRPDIVYDLPQRSHPMRGQPAPDFTMTLLGTNEQISLSDYAGRPVLIDFWATWCPPCRIEMPYFQSVHEKYADDGLVILGFNVGEKVPESLAEQQIQDFVTSNGLTFPILVGEQDLEVQRAWSVMGYPSAFFVSRDGVIVDIHQGMFPNQLTLESKLNETILADGEDEVDEG